MKWVVWLSCWSFVVIGFSYVSVVVCFDKCCFSWWRVGFGIGFFVIDGIFLMN